MLSVPLNWIVTSETLKLRGAQIRRPAVLPAMKISSNPRIRQATAPVQMFHCTSNAQTAPQYAGVSDLQVLAGRGCFRHLTIQTDTGHIPREDRGCHLSWVWSLHGICELAARQKNAGSSWLKPSPSAQRNLAAIQKGESHEYVCSDKARVHEAHVSEARSMCRPGCERPPAERCEVASSYVDFRRPGQRKVSSAGPGPAVRDCCGLAS